jgi:ABC-type lipoprotein release transport system permease subunit
VLILRLAWRNLGRNPRRTGIVLTAVAVGIAGVVLSMAINNGLVLQMVETAIATELGHLQVHAAGFDENPMLRLRLVDGGRAAGEALESLSGVKAWTPRVRSEGLVSSARANVGVRVVGIEPGRESAVSNLAESIVEGAFLDGASRRILIGEKLARRLDVTVGSKVVLSVQDLRGDLTGEAFRVAGLFRTASAELDRGTVYLRLEESQKLLRLGQSVSELIVIADTRGQIRDIQQGLRTRLGDELEVQTWEELRPLLVQMVEIFDRTAWYVYSAVFVAMVFGIANVLLMSVFERMREIGILMAVGLRPGRLVGLITAESMLLTFLGLAIGYGAAVACVLALHDGIDMSLWAEGLTAVGVGTRIVPVIRANDVVVPVAVAWVTALVASLWPALRAARLRPAEAVRRI